MLLFISYLSIFFCHSRLFNIVCNVLLDAFVYLLLFSFRYAQKSCNCLFEKEILSATCNFKYVKHVTNF